MFELMRELFEILNRRRRRRGSIDFDLKEPEIVLDDEGMVEEIIAAERNIAHRLIEEFMLRRERDRRRASRRTRRADALPRPRGTGSAEGRRVRGVHLDARLQPRQATLGRVSPRDFQKLVERMRGHAGREADRVPDAADDAEGALRPVEPRALRPRRRQLHALHLADPPLSRTSSSTARCASRVTAA